MTTRKRPAYLRPLTAALLTSGCLGLLPLQAGAATMTYSWIGGVNNSWIEGGNWEPPGPPTAGSLIDITLPGAVVNYDSDQALIYHSMSVSGGDGPGPVLNLPSYNLSFADWVYIGDRGRINQTGGNLYAAGMGVGLDGSGIFLHSAGQVEITGDLNIAVGTASQGSYEISGGNLTTQQLRIGESGRGHFYQTGGTVDVRTSGGFSILVMAEDPGSSGFYDLSSGTLNAERVYIGDSDQATFVHRGDATHNASELFLGIYKDDSQHGQGSYSLSESATLQSQFMVVGAQGTGYFQQSGGTHTNTGNIVLGADPGSQGTYDLAGGTLTSPEVSVNGGGSFGYGQFLYSGGSLITDRLNNAGFVEFSGDGRRVVDGEVFNAEGAMMKAFDTQVEFTRTFTNAGAYVSDPSDNYFQDLVVTETGYLYGGPGDRFYIAGDFLSSSTRNTEWFTLNSQLIFVGDKQHWFSITGDDLGQNPAGYFDNFAWGDLQLEDEVLFLQDGNATPGGALYVGTLYGLVIADGDTIGNIYGNGLNIYYAPGANPGLGGKTYALLNGGSLAPVPEPETWVLLLAGLGLVGWAARRRG